MLTSVIVNVPASRGRCGPLRGPQRRNRPWRVTLKIRLAQSRVMRNISSLPLNKLLKECELDVFRHDVWWSLNLSFLHKKLKVCHDFVFELLQPLVEFHMILVRLRIVVLPASCLSPVGLRKFERVIDFSVQNSVPLARLSIESNSQDTGLDSEL